jgi:hypothetical protein
MWSLIKKIEHILNKILNISNKIISVNKNGTILSSKQSKFKKTT